MRSVIESFRVPAARTASAGICVPSRERHRLTGDARRGDRAGVSDHGRVSRRRFVAGAAAAAAAAAAAGGGASAAEAARRRCATAPRAPPAGRRRRRRRPLGPRRGARDRARRALRRGRSRRATASAGGCSTSRSPAARSSTSGRSSSARRRTTSARSSTSSASRRSRARTRAGTSTSPAAGARCTPTPGRPAPRRPTWRCSPTCCSAIPKLNSLSLKVPVDAPWDAPGAAQLDSESLETWLRRNSTGGPALHGRRARRDAPDLRRRAARAVAAVRPVLHRRLGRRAHARHVRAQLQHARRRAAGPHRRRHAADRRALAQGPRAARDPPLAGAPDRDRRAATST